MLSVSNVDIKDGARLLGIAASTSMCATDHFRPRISIAICNISQVNKECLGQPG
jgi:hypothetical protein